MKKLTDEQILALMIIVFISLCIAGLMTKSCSVLTDIFLEYCTKVIR